MQAALLNRHNKKDIFELLDNNKEIHMDVVVVGAGFSGLIYALNLKRMKPDAKIAVLEIKQEPGYKIGESLLSPATRMLSTNGLPPEVMQRIFAVKAGLKFFYTNETQKIDATTEVDIGGLDISFQIDRRVSELLLTLKAQREGIYVYHGTMIDFKDRDNYIGRDKKTVNCTITNGNNEKIKTVIISDLICDASGSSRKIASMVGEKKSFEDATFNCNAYWAYFKAPEVVKTDINGWNYPSTQHICFPEGWMWGIRLYSYENTPLASLVDYINHVLDEGTDYNKTCYGIKQLEKLHNNKIEKVYSVGFTVRNDMLPTENFSTDSEKFYYWINKYPEIKKIMDNYELLENHYNKTTFFVRDNLAYYSEKVVGKNWMAIGDAAAFTNPLVSPGLNYSIGHAWLAARQSSQYLETKKNGEQLLSVYAQHINKLRKLLHAENKMYYLSFLDNDFYRKVFCIKFAAGIGDLTQYYTEYTERDIDPYFIFDPEYIEFLYRSIEILEEYDNLRKMNRLDDQEAVKKIRSDFDANYEKMKQICLKKHPKTEYSRYLTKYEDNLKRNDSKMDRVRGLMEFARCPHCQEWHLDDFPICAYCGLNL